MTAGAGSVSATGRCWWCGDDALYCAYHDEEWGVPVADETRLYEKLVLEGFQAGLSWLTILRKRPRFREVFHGFDPERVVRMTARDVERLVQDPGIIRHRGKIESALANARRVLELRSRPGGLPGLVWAHEPATTPPIRHRNEVVTTRPEAIALSKVLRKQGWSFVGPTTVYAFMQSVGMVNDHLLDCPRHGEIERLRRAFRRPKTADRR